MSRLRILQAPVVLALFALLLWRAGVDDAGRAFGDVDPWLAVAVIGLNVPLAVLYAVRSHLLLVRMGHRLPRAMLLSIAVLGNVAGTLTPASSGEVLRASALRSRAGMAGSDGAALVIFERVLSLYLMATGTAIAAAWFFLPLWAGVVAAIAVLPAATLPIVASPLLRFIPRMSDRDGVRQGVLPKALRGASDVAQQMQRLLRDVRVVLAWEIVTAGAFATATLQYWLLARSLSTAVSPGQMWVVFGASQLAGIASLLPLGLGAADGSMAALLRRMGTTFEQGTVVAILVRATMTLPLGIMAVVSYLHLVRTTRQSTRLDEPVRTDASVERG